MTQLKPINIRFDGLSDISNSVADTWAASTGKAATIVARFKPVVDTGSTMFVMTQNVARLAIRMPTANKILIEGKDSSGTMVVEHKSLANFSAGTWYTIVFSCDTANDKSYYYLNGADQGAATTLTTDGVIDVNVARYWSLAARNTNDLGIDGLVSVVAYSDEYNDLSDATVRARFVNTDGTLTEPGIDGTNWFQSQPRLMWKGSIQNWSENWGTELDFGATLSNQEGIYIGESDGARRNPQYADNLTMSGTSDVSFDGTNNTIDSAGSGFNVTSPYGLKTGEWVYVNGSVGNDGYYKIHASTAPTAAQITLDASTAVTTEAASAVKVRVTRTRRRTAA